MAHKTFISYKYSEAKGLRDSIIKKLGDDYATYYKGEDGYSDDLSSYESETIKRRLSDMIFDTSVMIVIVSPNMKLSKWMEWEIKYALREQSRNGRTSHSDGVICVVQKNVFYAAYGLDPYSWAKTFNGSWDISKLFGIINDNRNNKKPWMQSDIPANQKPKYDALSQHYIDIITEDEFMNYPFTIINNTFEKSNNLGSYDISKQ